ncbi:hypothetical protein RND81_11G087200 [Saponaria officinalis]|uniref:Uncharacterized protein n=1 Tax=Saponaria officinalis TaxID=3572 RepID=A0AAW1HIN2_SAPOF
MLHGILTHLMQHPTQSQWDAALRVICYLKGSPGQGILLRTGSSLESKFYCDADWASYPISRRSLTAYFIILGVRQQPTIHIENNPVFRERTKHIKIYCHFVRDEILRGIIAPSYVHTTSQLTDILTKYSVSMTTSLGVGRLRSLT